MTSTRSSPTSVSPVDDSPVWAGPDGAPTAHVARAAVHVAAVIDANGSRVVDADESYWRRATGGLYAPPDLRLGQQLLLDVGLVERRGDVLFPTLELQALVEGPDDDSAAALGLWAAERAIDPSSPSVPEGGLTAMLEELVDDPARREEMLIAFGRRFDDSRERLIGEIGEELVMQAARLDLQSLGYPELAARVRRISLDTDQAGYDISAPRVVGPPRLLEVKATTGAAISEVAVHLSRNEFETGNRYSRDWSLVVCAITNLDTRAGEILGWIPVTVLADATPSDTARGRWESALVTFETDSLWPGLPPSA
jgi:hypothetical protein